MKHDKHLYTYKRRQKDTHTPNHKAHTQCRALEYKLMPVVESLSAPLSHLVVAKIQTIQAHIEPERDRAI